MSRWQKDSITAIADPFFTCLVQIMHHGVSPTMHASHFIKKSQSDSDKERHRSTMAQLICGKHKELADEYDKLLDDDLLGGCSC